MENSVIEKTKQEKKLAVYTSRFGEIEYIEKDMIIIPRGLFGFEHLHEYLIVERENSRPFVWLQSIENPGLALPIVDPLYFKPDYEVKIHLNELKEIDVHEISQARTFVIATIPRGNPQDISLNLLGPIVINIDNRRAMQVALADSEYDTKYYLMQNR
ncbi:MAG: flagellar assembly protein FliW [candidate division Zixibacteria bacterium]|nr:flagellar assembly protein FliW [candidate division Zixibacteria bacterium]